MKKASVFLILIVCVCLLAACAESAVSAKVEITTAKAGKINVSVFAQDLPADKQDKANALTPTVTLNEKKITDDGKGLYRITFDTSGEGTVSVASTTVQSGDSLTVQAGTSVTVTTTPATDWKLNVCMLDWEVVQSNTFEMPEHDVTFLVSFISKRHSVSRGGSGGGYIVLPREDYADEVEGATVEFTIDETELSNDWFYYEDEDVFVESSVEDETGNRERVNVQKVGENRFRFVMPTFDCNIVMNKRDFGKIKWIVISKRNDREELNQIDDNEIANHIAFTLTMDNAPFEVNARVKRHLATLTATYLNPLYEIEDVLWEGRSDSSTKVDDTHYTFTVGYGYLNIILKNKEVPDGSHAITVNNSEHGTIAADKGYAEAGETVTVTVTPDEEYHLVSLQYSYENDVWNDIALQNGAYVFTMPDSDVTLRATFNDAPVTSGNFHVYVANAVLDGEEHALTEVVGFIELHVNEQYVEIGEITDDLTFPVELGQIITLGIHMNEAYALSSVSFRNSDVTLQNEGYYGMTEFEIGEDDLNGCVVIVFDLN